MALIQRKKRVYELGDELRAYLRRHGRVADSLPHYEALDRYTESVPVYNKAGKDTLWETVLYPSGERDEIHRGLVRTYATLKVMGNMDLVPHLVTDRVDVCTWGNTKPFRVRILNTLNENFDYFYVKRVDASRIYGLELEHILSPNRIEFLCSGETIVEEHIAGIPASDFIQGWLTDNHLDEVRLAKEFVKFNERCFVRLLGDMHSGNYVVDLTPDFDETHYRLRAIDFDQQSYEPRRKVYLPQFYKENLPIVQIAMRCMSRRTVEQYRQEELSLIASRVRAEQARLDDLIFVMTADRVAPQAHVVQLGRELSEHYGAPRFEACGSMGELVRASIDVISHR